MSGPPPSDQATHRPNATVVPAVRASDHGGAVHAACDALRTGQVVALPTDTVYGIAALPGLPGATDQLFELKGRTTRVPIAVLCADAQQALGLADPTSLGDEVPRIAERLWPGPLTLVLRRHPGLGYALGEPADTIGVRCPDHPLIQAIAADVGPIATTSANRHGDSTPPTAGEAAATFGDGVALVIDGGPCTSPASTVVDATGSDWRVLRQGELPLAAVERASRP